MKSESVSMRLPAWNPIIKFRKLQETQKRRLITENYKGSLILSTQPVLLATRKGILGSEKDEGRKKCCFGQLTNMIQSCRFCARLGFSILRSQQIRSSTFSLALITSVSLRSSFDPVPIQRPIIHLGELNLALP